MWYSIFPSQGFLIRSAVHETLDLERLRCAYHSRNKKKPKTSDIVEMLQNTFIHVYKENILHIGAPPLVFIFIQ